MKLGIDAEKAVAELGQEHLLAGVPLKHHFPDLADSLLVATTEMVDQEQIDLLVEKLEKMAGKGK